MARAISRTESPGQALQDLADLQCSLRDHATWWLEPFFAVVGDQLFLRGAADCGSHCIFISGNADATQALAQVECGGDADHFAEVAGAGV